MISLTKLPYFIFLWLLAFNSLLITQRNSLNLVHCSSSGRKFDLSVLLNTQFETLSSGDEDLDICKALKQGRDGDIALGKLFPEEPPLLLALPFPSNLPATGNNPKTKKSRRPEDDNKNHSGLVNSSEKLYNRKMVKEDDSIEKQQEPTKVQQGTETTNKHMWRNTSAVVHQQYVLDSQPFVKQQVVVQLSPAVNKTNLLLPLQHDKKNGQRTRRRRRKRAATARRERIWDFGVIPYEIDGNFSGSHKTLFKQAMRHWENNTCVKFVEKTEEHPNYIVFTEKACGCCSFVGKRGNGPQAISIGKNCDKFGIVVHELGHAVGFWHEHTRPDRDDHVVIIRENIMTGQEYNFNKLTPDEVHSLGETYDFDSIMHYARNTFSRSTFLDTILPREDPNSRHRPEIGQRIRLSSGDIAQANKLYKCPSCGRTLQEPSGSLGSPYHQSQNNSVGLGDENGEKCEWRIVATHGETIILNVTDFDLPYSDGCKYDYLEIRDGYWHKSPLLGRFCGSNLKFDQSITSTGARMLLTYATTKSPNTYRGFAASYEAICGGDLVEESGHLESPNFPDEYIASKECVWRITVPIGYQVALTFHSFEIENHENCVYDFLEVRDGLNQNSSLLGTFCGYYPPGPITSSSNHLWVRFVSDGSVQKAGFSASFLKELDECAKGLDDCEHTCKNTIGSYICGCKFGFELHSNGKECEDACGGVIEDVNGTLTSPSFPNLYPSNKHCAWEIVAPPQTRITINFTHFDLEGNNQECDYDSVEVYSKLGQDELKRHGSFCGSKPPPMITSEGNSIRVVFTSDNSVQKSGFALVFFTDKDECAINNGGCAQICRNTIGSYQCACQNGFTLHEDGKDCKEGGCKFEISTPPNGEITSPNFPDPYPGKKECVWLLNTVNGHRVKVVFDEFEVEPQQDCSYDSVIVYDGSSSEAPLLGKFCGSKIPHPLVASTNNMMVLFKSDASVHRRGFHGKYTTVCGGLLFAEEKDQFLYSHAGFADVTYSDSEDCEWVIEGEEEGPIELTFITFEIEDENDCAFDYVEVFNSEDTTSSLSLGKYCGNRIPPPVRSDEGTIVIKFKSDDTVASKGFSAVYRYAQGSSENGVDGGGTGGGGRKAVGKNLDKLRGYLN